MAEHNYVRVGDRDTGHKYTVAVVWSPETQDVLDEPAVDHRGRPLPPEHNTYKPKKARQASAGAPEDSKPEEAN